MTSLDFIEPTDTVGTHVADFMDEYGIKAPSLAKQLGIPRSRLQRLLDGARCDGDMALRLGRVFNTSPGYWLNLQSLRELSVAYTTAGDAIAAEVTPLNAVA